MTVCDRCRVEWKEDFINIDNVVLHNDDGQIVVKDLSLCKSCQILIKGHKGVIECAIRRAVNNTIEFLAKDEITKKCLKKIFYCIESKTNEIKADSSSYKNKGE